MQRKFKISNNNIISAFIIFILIPLTIVLSWHFGDRRYYICSVLIMIYAMVPFFAGFERRRPQPRELVTLAVMCAVAVVSRVAFVMLPQFKPMVGIVMITGMALGPQAGFLTGALSALISNFIFGQGAWTPWQMFAFGMAGFIAGVLCRKNIMGPRKPIINSVMGFMVTLVVVGMLLDTCTVFTMSSMINTESLAAVYLAGAPFNAVHGLATAATLLLLADPFMNKLERIKTKYGFMEQR